MVSRRHGKLPFGCAIERVPDVGEIITAWLAGPADGIVAWSELKDADDDANAAPSDAAPLKVWVRNIPG